MQERIARLIAHWQKRNITGIYCPDRVAFEQALSEAIPSGAHAGISGSVTLQQLDVVRGLQSRGVHVFDPAKAASREENLAVRRQGAQADYYLASPNAVAESGEMVFLSAYGNRTAGISYAAKKTVIIAGVNKLVPTLTEALQRAREYATPLNCKRLSWNTPCFSDGICRERECFLPEYKRMCCQVLILEAEAVKGRMTAILVDEPLGF